MANLVHSHQLDGLVLITVKVEPTMGRGGVGKHPQHVVKTKKKNNEAMNEEERLVLRVRISFYQNVSTSLYLPHHTLLH